MRRLVIGDIHGRSDALKEVLALSKFNYAEDKLIVLGDIADGGFETYEVVEELLKIKNIVFIIGNHDEWAMNHMQTGWAEDIWLEQGGVNTLRSYGGKATLGLDVTDSKHPQKSWVVLKNGRMPESHFNFFNKGKYFHIESTPGHEQNILFVHAGFDARHGKSVFQATQQELVWDRDLIAWCKEGNTIPEWEKVFIGHTTTELINGDTKPIRFKNLYCVDTGAGWTGCLTVMDIDTEQYWQSKIQRPALPEYV
jgi:Icc-related predicted phosphoesterase